MLHLSLPHLGRLSANSAFLIHSLGFVTLGLLLALYKLFVVWFSA